MKYFLSKQLFWSVYTSDICQVNKRLFSSNTWGFKMYQMANINQRKRGTVCARKIMKSHCLSKELPTVTKIITISHAYQPLPYFIFTVMPYILWFTQQKVQNQQGNRISALVQHLQEDMRYCTNPNICWKKF